MSLTTAVPIFPGFKPGRSWTAPGVPSRAPTWHWKETPKWNNSRQQATNGHMSVVKYWDNPLWDFEWTYGYIKDNPTDLNPYYPRPIPATDLDVLRGFHGAMQGGGNQFLYQAPDSTYGGTMTVTGVASVPGVSNLFNIYGTNFASLGHMVSIPSSALTNATFLNGKNLTILGGGYGFGYITVYVSSGTYAFTADTGTVFCGQLLSVDGNNNAELTHTYGAYPTIPLTGTPPAYTLTTESVQVIDSSTLTVWANGAVTSGYTLAAADTIPGYEGLVVQFPSAPTAPVVASFNWFYLCRFSEDSLEWDNFLTMLYACSKFEFEQDRI